MFGFVGSVFIPNDLLFWDFGFSGSLFIPDDDLLFWDFIPYFSDVDIYGQTNSPFLVEKLKQWTHKDTIFRQD